MKWLLAIAAFFLPLYLLIAGVSINIVYPRYDPEGNPPVLPKVDSVFVFGSVKPAMTPVIVNGFPATVYPSGAFMAFIPLRGDWTAFKVEAMLYEDRTVFFLPFDFPQTRILSSKSASDISPMVLASQSLPAMLTVTHPHAVMRYSPHGGVYYIFPDSGATVWAEKIEESFYGFTLNESNELWIEDRFVSVSPGGFKPAVSRIYKAFIEEDEEESRLIIPNACRPVKMVKELNNPARLRLYLYGVESHLDLIRYDGVYIREVTWRQDNPETMVIDISVDSPRLWGYRSELRDDEFVFHIKRPPKMRLKGLKVAVDPGHGGDNFGAIGPTGLTEKEVNLLISKELVKMLRGKGAEVMMTRVEDIPIELYRRVDMAEAWGADIFISVHNNALSDGKNPFTNRGTGVHFYHRHSADLARCIHTKLLEILKLQDDGLYYHDLAVARATGMLSVLVVVAFIMHPDEEEMLRQSSFRHDAAAAIFHGLKEFIKIAKDEENGDVR